MSGARDDLFHQKFVDIVYVALLAVGQHLAYLAFNFTVVWWVPFEVPSPAAVLLLPLLGPHRGEAALPVCYVLLWTQQGKLTAGCFARCSTQCLPSRTLTMACQFYRHGSSAPASAYSRRTRAPATASTPNLPPLPLRALQAPAAHASARGHCCGCHVQPEECARGLHSHLLHH